MNKWKQVFGLLSLFIAAPLVCAEEEEEIEWMMRDWLWRPVIVAGGGLAISSDFRDSTKFEDGISLYQYKSEESTETRGLFGGLIGAEFLVDSDWLVQTGIAYYQNTPFTSEGMVTQGIDPQSYSEYDYHYDIVSHQLLVDTKLLMNNLRGYHPYVSVGLGLSFNETEDYHVQIPDANTFSPLYEGKTETAFTWSVGIGLDVDVTDYMRLGVGYRFADLGKTSLGRGVLNNSAVEHTLTQSHLYTQEVLAQLTVLM